MGLGMKSLAFGALGLASLGAVNADCGADAYDVIVVGAGPAGIVVADRMSEAGKKTLLLEQGGPSYYITGGRKRPGWLNGTDLSRVDVPGLYKSIFATQDNLTCSSDWLNSFSGCTLGGCTAINAGLFFQPPASDFDLYFPDEWKSKDVQSAISKVRAKQPFTDNPSQDGKWYLQTGYDAAKRWLVDGAGYDEVTINDAADDKTKVFGHPEFYYEHGQRSGPVKTYLQTALQRPNFELQTGARVQHVVRDGETATGVIVELVGINSTTGPKKTFSVCNGTGRVILSGGALASPQLLMWSGIGDPEVLTNLTNNGILSLPSSQWINNTAVGDKLFDNPNTFIEITGPTLQSYDYSYDAPDAASKELYLTQRAGPYSFASETSAFWDMIPDTDNSTNSSGIIGCQGTIDSSGALDFTANNTITLNVYGTSGLHSTGKVVLTDTGLAGANAFFYTDPRDAVAVGKFIYGILQKLPADLDSHPIAKNSTLSEVTTWVSTWSSYTLGNVLHWSSSCRIGTCVDTDTVVVGMENLHVVDASIVPPLSTNPVFGIMIAAERAVERILALGGETNSTTTYSHRSNRY